MKRGYAMVAGLTLLLLAGGLSPGCTYVIVDTMQQYTYDTDGNVIPAPSPGEYLYGQDAQYDGVQPSYQDNGDGTVADLNTGLSWQKTPNYQKYGFFEADDYCETLTLAGIDDWRLPTAKELFSIVDFRGELDPDSPATSTPYIDVDVFDFIYDPNGAMGSTYWSSNQYLVGGLIDGDALGAFGYNFADGHLKAYPTGYSFADPTEKVPNPIYNVPSSYIRCVSDVINPRYGQNYFVDNGDGTVTDRATGLMWQQADDTQTRDWPSALAYAESLELAGYNDWRLPNPKELQSLVDYDKTEIPVIDENFFVLSESESWLWTNTTLGDNKFTAVYFAFGKAYAKLINPPQTEYFDHHGAGAQRSDPKVEDPTAPPDYGLASPTAIDEIRIYNYVLCVRDAE